MSPCLQLLWYLVPKPPRKKIGQGVGCVGGHAPFSTIGPQQSLSNWAANGLLALGRGCVSRCSLCGGKGRDADSSQLRSLPAPRVPP